jgi:hypothetical protein
MSYIVKRGHDNVQLVLLPLEDYRVHIDRLRERYAHFSANRLLPPYEGVWLSEPTDIVLGKTAWIGVDGYKEVAGKCVMWQWELVGKGRRNAFWLVVTTVKRQCRADFEPFIASVSDSGT